MSISTSQRTSKRAAFTLAELFVTLSIGIILVGVIAGLSLYSGRSFAALANYVDLNNRSQLALQQLSRDVRLAMVVQSYTNNTLTLVESDGSMLEYKYDPAAGTLCRVRKGISMQILSGCDALEFVLLGRRDPGGSFYEFPETNAPNCIMIEVSWKCSRNLLGQKVNTESVQGAKIVLRQ